MAISNFSLSERVLLEIPSNKCFKSLNLPVVSSDSCHITPSVDGLPSGIDADNLSLHSGSSEFVNDGIEIKYFDTQGKVIRSEFKNNYTQYHKKQYSKIIYFGDSLTDLNSSLSSDYVFATGKLHDYYIKNRMECVKFDDYNDMITKINEILF